MTSPDIVKQGYVRYQSKHLGVWKKRWLVLRQKSSTGPARLEKYKTEGCVYDTSLGLNAAVVDLQHIDSVDRLPESVRKHGISIVDHVKIVQFSADSEMEANKWVEAIKQEKETSKNTQNSYKVYLMKHVKLVYSGECTLFVGTDEVRILDIHTKRELVSWPFKSLRRYGVERNMLTLEAGRSCSTGEGVFLFDADDAEAVYQCIHAAAQRLKRNKEREQARPGQVYQMSNESRDNQYHGSLDHRNGTGSPGWTNGRNGGGQTNPRPNNTPNGRLNNLSHDDAAWRRSSDTDDDNSTINDIPPFKNRLENLHKKTNNYHGKDFVITPGHSRTMHSSSSSWDTESTASYGAGSMYSMNQGIPSSKSSTSGYNSSRSSDITTRPLPTPSSPARSRRSVDDDVDSVYDKPGSIASRRQKYNKP